MQIGNRDDTGVGSAAADTAVKALQDYVELFIRRNPQLYVFGAYIHMDEETPHVHIDFVPFSTDNKRGLEIKIPLRVRLPPEVLKVRARVIPNGSSGRRQRKKILP